MNLQQWQDVTHRGICRILMDISPMTTNANAASYASLVQELYVAYFGRPADYYGLQNFETSLANAGAPTTAAGLLGVYGSNAAVKSLVDAFGTSAESQTLYGGGSTETFVNAIFENLFNRPAAVAGLSFWVDAINSGSVTRGEAALEIAAGAQGNTSAQGLADAQTLSNKMAASQVFTDDLGASGTITDYAGTAAAGLGRVFISSVTSATTPAEYTAEAGQYVEDLRPHQVFTYTLTAGADNFTGAAGTNYFIGTLNNAAGIAAGGPAQTLNDGDTVVGGSGNNILQLTDYGQGGVGTLPSGATIENITSLVLSSQEGLSANLATWQGLATLSVNGSSGQDTFTVGVNATVNISDSAGDVSVVGGATANIFTDAGHAVSLDTIASRLTVNLGNSSNTIVDTCTGALVDITAGTGANSITLGAGATGTITLAPHNGGDAVTLGPSGASAATIVTISGLNNATGDVINFSTEQPASGGVVIPIVPPIQQSVTLVGFQQITGANVTASGGNAALLASWVAAADGAAGSGISGAAHTVNWFVFQGNTYILESVAGPSADAGTMAADNTLVELTGTGCNFSHASGANGALHLLG